MSNVISFLEMLGSNASATQMTAEQYASAVVGLNLQTDVEQALLTRDGSALNAALGAPLKMISLLVPAEPETPDQDKPSPDQEPPATPN